jgi:hypothetical protein
MGWITKQQRRIPGVLQGWCGGDEGSFDGLEMWCCNTKGEEEEKKRKEKKMRKEGRTRKRRGGEEEGRNGRIGRRRGQFWFVIMQGQI